MTMPSSAVELARSRDRETRKSGMLYTNSGTRVWSVESSQLDDAENAAWQEELTFNRVYSAQPWRVRTIPNFSAGRGKIIAYYEVADDTAFPVGRARVLATFSLDATYTREQLTVVPTKTGGVYAGLTLGGEPDANGVFYDVASGPREVEKQITQIEIGTGIRRGDFDLGELITAGGRVNAVSFLGCAAGTVKLKSARVYRATILGTSSEVIPVLWVLQYCPSGWETTFKVGKYCKTLTVEKAAAAWNEAGVPTAWYKGDMTTTTTNANEALSHVVARSKLVAESGDIQLLQADEVTFNTLNGLLQW